jgi:WD repeat-containing protein 61
MNKMPEVELLSVISAHSAGVYALASAGPGSFYSGSADKHVAEWNLETFTQEKLTITLDASVYSLCKIEKHNLLVIGLSNGSIHVIDLLQKKEIRHLKQHRSGVFDLKYAERKNQLYSSDGQGFFCAWEVPSFDLAITLPLCDEKLRQIDLHPGKNEIAVACGDHHVRIIETDFFNEIHRISSHSMSVNAVHYRDNGTLLTGGKDAWLKIFDVRNNYAELTGIPAHNYAIYDIVSDPSGKYFATVSRDKTIKLWDSEADEFLLRIDRKKFNGHLHSVNCALWHKEKNLLVTGSDDRSIRIWKIS